MKKNRIEVKSTDSEGKEITVYVVRPSSKDLAEAQLVAGSVLKKGMDNNALMRHQLRDYMVKNGMWSEEQDKAVSVIDEEIYKDLLKLKTGGIKLNEAKDLAIGIRAKRTFKILLEAQKRQLDEYTVESLAENARFDYLVSVSVRDENGDRIFKDLDDYKNRATEPFAFESASTLASLINDFDKDWEKNLPENQFLIKYKLVDENLRLVDKEGHYVTADGKRVDKDFNYIDENGNKIDTSGAKLDDDGLPHVESQPFLDDDGNPITE